MYTAALSYLHVRICSRLHPLQVCLEVFSKVALIGKIGKEVLAAMGLPNFRLHQVVQSNLSRCCCPRPCSRFLCGRLLFSRQCRCRRRVCNSGTCFTTVGVQCFPQFTGKRVESDVVRLEQIDQLLGNILAGRSSKLSSCSTSSRQSPKILAISERSDLILSTPTRRLWFPPTVVPSPKAKSCIFWASRVPESTLPIIRFQRSSPIFSFALLAFASILATKQDCG